jgi:hypothetical protein
MKLWVGRSMSEVVLGVRLSSGSNCCNERHPTVAELRLNFRATHCSWKGCIMHVHPAPTDAG